MIGALPRLHAVTDDRVLAEGLVRERAGPMAEAAGPALAVHLRSRVLAGGAFLALARELAALLEPHGSWLAVNGRADVARAAGARIVVSGRGGLVSADVRRVAPQTLIGRSVHDAAESRRAHGEGADFLIAGGGAPVVRSAAATGRPAIAIGGITPANTPEALGAGAWGVAAIRALWDAPDAARAARDFLDVLPRDETVGVVINGRPRRARTGLSLAGLLTDLGLDPRAVVVEHNRRIVRREALAQALVDEGDAIELVHFVGGG